MAEAWAATRGKRWRLLGMAFLLGLAVVVAVALVGDRSGRHRRSSTRPLVSLVLVGVVLGDAAASATCGSGSGSAPSPVPR